MSDTKLEPPSWMVELGRDNPVVYAYLKLGKRDGFGEALFSLLAHELAIQNGIILKQLIDAAKLNPTVLIIRPEARDDE